MINPLTTFLLWVYAVAGGVSIFMVAPICFLLFTKILLFLVMRKGIAQLKRTMRWIGKLCFPAFVACVINVMIQVHIFIDGGMSRLVAMYEDDGLFFWVPFYGAALSFVFYLGEKSILRKGRKPGDRFYIIWFLFFLIMCYGAMLAWPFLPGPR